MLMEQIRENQIFNEEDAALVGFQMLKKTLANTEMIKRSEKLDKMKGKKYWSLESEMTARAFDFLFDSIRFHDHDKNYELYSAAAENIAKKFAEANLIEQDKLTEEQKFLQTFSREIFDSEVKFFEGLEEIHSRYNYDTDIFYHETFHALKIAEPELYEDLREHVERENMFTQNQIKNYRQAEKQPSLSDAKVVEEMLADAFADLNSGRKILQNIAEKKSTLAKKSKLMQAMLFTQLQVIRDNL